MQEIIWTDEFSVGIARIDEQHRRLVDMINKLISDPTATSRSETVSDVLGEMTDYVKMHFAYEEKLMGEHGYPQLGEQVKEHRAFQEDTAKFCMAAAVHLDRVPEMLMEHLSQWLVHHILEVDMAYRPFFQAQGVQ
jgi:hemerythrin